MSQKMDAEEQRFRRALILLGVIAFVLLMGCVAVTVALDVLGVGR